MNNQEFIKFSLDKKALRFGEFTTKAGRISPYFFNAGLFSDGQSLLTLARFYANSILESKIEFDMIFGPAYKGIVLAAAVSMMLAEKGKNVPYAYNRKEVKDHGEGGLLVGSPLNGRVLIIDDVVSAGISVRESIEIIRQAGAEPVAVSIAIDRMERGAGTLSATQEINQHLGLAVISIINIHDILHYASYNPDAEAYAQKIRNYRSMYGV
jgi:orotate phosphoribosyltransferase